MSDWTKEPPKPEELGSKWSDRPPSPEEIAGHLSLEPQNHSSATVAAIQHGLNKATGGFSDELQGLGEAAGRLVGVDGAGGPMKDMHFAEGGPTHDWNILKDAYQRARNHEREVLKQQEKEHPIASGVGDVVGSVASPINKAVKGMSLAKAGAVLGGINSLGSTEKEDLPGMAQDVAVGTGTGMLMGKTLSKLGVGAKNAIEDVATAPLGPSVPTPEAPIKKVFDPFLKKASTIVGPEPEAPGVVTKAMQGVNQLGEKGNEFLDKITGSKIGRYLVSPKIQFALDTAENAPKAAQWAAGKASNGIDKAQDFLLKNPRLQELAQNSPKAFSALVSDFGRKVGAPASNVAGPNQAPVDDEKARQAFLSGN